MKTSDIASDSYIDRNIEMGFDFVKETLDDPSLLDNVPDGAAVIQIPGDDAELAEHNLALALDAARRGHDVYIRHVRTSTIDH